MGRQDVVCFKQAKRYPLTNGQVDSTAQDRADSVAWIKSAYRQAVVAQQEKKVASIRSPNEPGPARSRGVVISIPPVMCEVEFQSPMGIKVVGQGTPETFGHIRNLKRDRTQRITKGSGDAAAGMQPLIADKQVPLRVRIALRDRRTRD